LCPDTTCSLNAYSLKQEALGNVNTKGCYQSHLRLTELKGIISVTMEMIVIPQTGTEANQFEPIGPNPIEKELICFW